MSQIKRSLWRKGRLFLHASRECLGARDVLWYGDKQAAHETVKMLPWERIQWEIKWQFQTLTPPKWELATFKGSTIFICTNPVLEPGLIASLEDKRTPKRQKMQEKFLFTFSHLYVIIWALYF